MRYLELKSLGKYIKIRFLDWIKNAREESAGWVRFWHQLYQYKRLASSRTNEFQYYLYPCLNDSTNVTPIEPIYFYQDAWAFEHIVKKRPSMHVDIGSHHKFVALLSKVVPVTMVDIRPLSISMSSIAFQAGSILDLPFPDNSLPSVSSICVIEHIGLGRYGDPLDAWGTEKALAELKRVLIPGGNLYISLPIEDQNKIYFNAHRAYKEEYMLELFSPFEVMDKKYICGNQFTGIRSPGFSTGCYFLRKPYS